MRHLARLLARPAAMALVLSALLLVPAHGSAFCGFYVGGAGSTLYANATMVVMMREGTRTVLSMQNNYAGPPADFAMVVPVPVVLSEDDVRTLPREIFERVDTLAAPRLVEYWEVDPCDARRESEMREEWAEEESAVNPAPSSVMADDGVRVEAEFAVGEYDIVILSASDSSGLERWLHAEHYNIPEGAAEVLRPYVEAGTKFFVARVNIERVTFVDGRALLSPLRVSYETPEFSLPVRLGLLSSAGQQDLIVHILSRERFEVANYRNVTIPTNIRVAEGVRGEFGSFYEYLFRETVARNPRTVVTEYSWSAGSCDPCPTPPLESVDITLLGGDVISSVSPYDLTLTRLHYRYTRDDLGEDLVFRPAPAIYGGRGIPDASGHMIPGASPAEWGGNQFQARYVMLHAFEGALTCSDPLWGSWGGPPHGDAPPPAAARNTALTTGIPDASLNAASLLVDPVPEIGAAASAPSPVPAARAEGPSGARRASASFGSESERVGDEPPPPMGNCSRAIADLGCRAGSGRSPDGPGVCVFVLVALVVVRARRTRR